MSTAEAGSVFCRARGRTLDAFPAGTRGGNDFGLRNLPPGNLQCGCVHLQPDPTGAAVGVGDQNKVRTARAPRLPRALWRRECPREEAGPGAPLAST